MHAGNSKMGMDIVVKVAATTADPYRPVRARQRSGLWMSRKSMP
jgi:hypothetical protein